MNSSQKQNTKNSLKKEIDLLEFVGKVFSRWKFVLKFMVCFMVLGVVMALSSIKEYTAKMMVAPESSGSSVMSGGLTSLATLAGFDLGSIAGGEDAIYPLLYPDIIQSLPFQSSLFDVKVKSLDGSIDTTYYYYKKELQKTNWLDAVKSAPLKVKGLIGNLFSSENEEAMVGASNAFDPYKLTKKQMGMIDDLNEAITISVDKQTNVITLSYTDQDPLIAATMVDTIMCRLQEQITAYRTQKAMDDCAYIEKLYLESKSEYEKAQEAYAMYVDRNRNVTQERFLVEKERLEADKNLKNTLYTQWAQQLQLAKAKVQEYTPAFTTLKPASVPALPSSMSRLMILVLYTFVGGVLAVLYVLLKDDVVEVFRELLGKNKSIVPEEDVTNV